MKKIALVFALLTILALGASAQPKPKQVTVMGYPGEITTQGTIKCGPDLTKVCIKINIGSRLAENTLENEEIDSYSSLDEGSEMWLSVFTSPNSFIELTIRKYTIKKNPQGKTEISFE
jgi:hypothetical protein